MSLCSLFDDATLSSNVPTTSFDMKCVERSDSSMVFVSTDTSDSRVQRRLTVKVRPANDQTLQRQKVSFSMITPVLFDEDTDAERVELKIARLELEVPASSTFDWRLSMAKTELQRLVYACLNSNADNDTIESALKYGAVVQD